MSDTPRQTAYLVLGAPRSGTSAVSHFLSNCGIDFGDKRDFIDTTLHKHNPIFFELEWVNQLNDRVFEALGGSWDDNRLPLSGDFSASCLEPLRVEAREKLRSYWPDAPRFGIKDPRFCFTLPFWQGVLADNHCDVRLVWSLRRMAAVIESNRAVNGWELDRVRRFIAESTLSCRYMVANSDCVYLDYDSMVSNPLEFAADSTRRLGFLDVDPNHAVSHIQPAIRHNLSGKSTGVRWLDRIDERLFAQTLTPDEFLDYREMAALTRHGFLTTREADSRVRSAHELGRSELADQRLAELVQSVSSLGSRFEHVQGLIDQVGCSLSSARIESQESSRNIEQALQALSDSEKQQQDAAAFWLSAYTNLQKEHEAGQAAWKAERESIMHAVLDRIGEQLIEPHAAASTRSHRKAA